jgi:membrane protein
VALGVLVFAATGFVGSLQEALDRIWAAPPAPVGIWSFIRTKLFSFTLILAAAFLLLVSLVLSTAMTALTDSFTTVLGLPEDIIQTLTIVANFLLAAIVFAAIFKFVPSAFVTWGAAIAGGLFTAVLFAMGRLALAWYLGREAEASAYGAATSLVLLLIWVYYSAQILFLGAQFSQTLQKLGSRPSDVVRPIARQLSPSNTPGHLSMIVTALGLGFVLGAVARQSPQDRRRPGAGFLQRAYSSLINLAQ